MKRTISAVAFLSFSCLPTIVSATPTDLSQMKPIKRGAYTLYTPYMEQAVKSLEVVAAPPISGSEAYEADKQAMLYEWPAARVAQATQDARISPDYFAKIYGEVIGVEISFESTPAIYTVIARSIADYGLATSDAKQHYARTRPFAAYELQTCTPYAEDYLRADGSYPSGHTATGYGISLVIAQIAPDYSTELIARGEDYGRSRTVCNVHYPSDVQAGILVAEAVAEAQLSSEQFVTDLKAAQNEWLSLSE
ncbi:acid phosphatase [Aliagarivorans marinus]|uniref:acid phosphatase n=1 Tax=Aliagarivorans marinus TaxID=561965 RepID=UPI0003F627FC|nr:phosphatase PAP2 family protein [Aliagarivorans marinus]